MKKLRLYIKEAAKAKEIESIVPQVMQADKQLGPHKAVTDAIKAFKSNLQVGYYQKLYGPHSSMMIPEQIEIMQRNLPQ